MLASFPASILNHKSTVQGIPSDSVKSRNALTDLDAAEVTLIHVETGASYVKRVRPTGEGLVVTGIPFGTYRAEVRVDGQPMRIRLWGPGTPEEFADSVTHDFTMGWLGNQFQVAVKP